ncbi:SCO family protein [uncultured Jannaschia sp.]|uniref:SCO family protein n=1 Tax=uncultured Jannaschia sp. TaxID=293347 RepID=UPI002631D7AA|nr:SCO family protein [uncultured Jannaschia sp.]
MKTLFPVLVAMALAGAANGHDSHATHDPARSTATDVAAERLVIRELDVTDSHGRSFPFLATFGRRGTLLLSFTYTNCETLCPVTNAILSGVDTEATKVGLGLTVLSMTIDPARDTPEQMAEERALWGAGENWFFLTAERGAHRRLMQDLSVDIRALEAHDPMFLLGDLCSGRFLRIVGVPEPSKLVDLARRHEPCDV